MVPKKRWFDSIVIVASDKIRVLMDENFSLMNNETKKGMLYGKLYFATHEHSIFKLTIALNDIRISINKSLLQLFINLAKKFKVYEKSKLC